VGLPTTEETLERVAGCPRELLLTRAIRLMMFAPIYGWFTEGFDTVDLQEAKSLLEALP
jgi:hypothetical protein